MSTSISEYPFGGPTNAAVEMEVERADVARKTFGQDNLPGGPSYPQDIADGRSEFVTVLTLAGMHV
jgi:hypothetical protein